MPMYATEIKNVFRITPPEGGFHNAQWTAHFLEGIHRQRGLWILETVVSDGKLGTLVSIHPTLGNPRYLQAMFGPTRESRLEDWMHLHRGEDASVATLHLRGHALLPTAGYSDREITQRWSAILKIERKIGRDLEPRMGVRVLLQPADRNWREAFKRGTGPGNPLRRMADWLLESEAKGGSAHIDPKLIAAKVSGLAFCIEIQVIVFYKSGPRESRRGKAALHHATEAVVDLLGGHKIWKKTDTTHVSGRKVYEDLRSIRSRPPRELTQPFDSAGSKRFVISPKEAAPFWYARQAVPNPAPPEALLTHQAAPEPEPLAAGVAASPAISTVAEVPGTGDAAGAERGAPLNGPPAQPIGPSPTPVQSCDEERVASHSAQPLEQPVMQMPLRNDLSRGKPRANRDPIRRSAAIAAAQTSTAREMSLSERDLLIFDQLAGLPLGTAQDVACIYGWSPTTCYQSLATLKGAGLVASAELNAGGAKEERFWIPDDQWGRIMGDRPRRHTGSMIQWLWINPQLVVAVYRLVGMAAQAVAERKILFLRWLRISPFEAVAEFSDGWVGFLWSGIWQDRDHLEKRLSGLDDECNGHLSGGQGTRRPGRIVFVVPHAWQAERVWRTVAGSPWQDVCAVYDRDEDTLTGDLDLRSSAGWAPAHIHDNLGPPRADMARWIDFLVHDTAGHLVRMLFAVEQHPGITPSRLQNFTGINGKNVKAGLHELLKRGLIYETPDGGYACKPWSLAMAARRDRAWLGLPGRRFGPDKLAVRSDQKRKHRRDVQRLLGKFGSAGCPVAPGWLAGDGEFRPDGAVWMGQGPYGPGWHYVVSAVSAKQTTSIGRVLRNSRSETRTDHYPVLVICRPEMEEICWRLGAGMPMLTASVSRIRAGPVAGKNGTAWSRYGEPVPVLAGPRA